MIGSSQALPQKRTTEEWKNARVELAKQGLQGVPNSTVLLQELLQICTQVETSTFDEKEIDRLLTEGLLPIGKVLVGMPVRDSSPVAILEPVEQTLRGLVRAGCYLFRQGATPKAAELLLAVLDFKKAVYKPAEEEHKEAKDTKPAEVTEVTAEQNPHPQTEEAIISDTYTIQFPNPIMAPSAAVNGLSLPPIRQTQTEDEVCIEQDRKHHHSHPDSQPIAMKRSAYRQLATDLTELFLSGTDKVWQNFSNRSVEFVDKYLAMLKQVSKLVNSTHLAGVFDKVREAVWKAFTQPSQQFLRGITKELMQEVTGNCQSLFDRLLLDKQKLDWCEHFVAEATLPLVRCKLAIKKLFGVKLLSTFATEIQNKHSKSLTQSEFKEWICEKRVLQEVLNLQNHEQVIQQGESIFEFLVRCGGLTQQQLDLVLNVAEKGNPSVRKSMLSKLYTLVHRFGYMQYEQLMHRLQIWQHEIFVDDLLDLLVSVCKNSVNAHCQMGRDILWQLISSNTALPISDERLAFKFIELLKITLERSTVADIEVYFDKAIDLIDRKADLMMTLLRRMISLYPESDIDAPEKRLDTQLISRMVIERELHLTLLKKLDQPDLSKDERQNCMDLLHILLSRYFKNFPEDSQLKTEMLLRLMNYPKLFSLLSQSFGETTQQLLAAAVSRSVNTQEELHCIWELFMNINKEMLIVNVQDKNLEVRCRPDDLKCYNRLLEIITSTTSEQVRQETASYLAAIHCNSEVGQRGTVANEFVEQVLSKLYDAYQESNQRQLLGYYSIIEELMNETERKGVGDLLAHSSLVVTEHLKIKVRNDATYGHDVPNRIEVPFPGSKSLYELLTTLAVQFKCSANEIRLYIDEKEPVRENKNGLAVEDLNLVGKDLVAKKMQRQTMPFAKLLDESRNYTPRAREVFTQVFQRFSTDGKMSKQDLVRFVEGSTQDQCNVNDSRITQTFDRYDDDKDGILTLANFLQFYEEACRNRQPTVWRNLETLRYRHDLQRCEQVKETVDYHNMTRFRLYRCAFSYDILFALTQSQDEQLKKKAIRLLKRLPTSHQVLRQILHEVSFNERDEFNVWYRLTLVQYLLSKKTEELKSAEPQVTVTSASELKKQTSTTSITSDIETVALTSEVLLPWKKKFIEEQIYSKILKEAELLTASPLKNMKTMSRQSLSLCLKTLRELNVVPELNKPLPDAFQVSLIQLPENKLVEVLLPQLFDSLVPQMLESLLCLAISTQEVHPQILKQGLFHPEQSIRLICCNFLYLHEKQHGFALNLVEVPVGGQPKQFYELLARVVRDSPNLNLQKIFTAMQKEVEDSPAQNEQILVGRLAVMHSTLQKQPELSLPGSYQSTLLKILHGTVNHDLRRVLYNMLLMTDPQGIIYYLNSFIKEVNPKLNSTPRSINYSGLYNLGCICYMNSMLQQFFMTTELRNAILGMQLPAQLPEMEVKGRKHVNNLLYQLQRMFTYLQLSERSDYNPEGFCYTFKPNINVGVQEDAQEFLNSIIEKLEATLKGTPYSNLLRDVFGGKTISTMTCQSCSKPRYKVEEFRSILLEIKEKKTMLESLNRFIEKESISEFYCEECGGRGEMIKETHLHTLPNILIVHLQRIVFDLEVMENRKIHTKFEFSMNINLKDFLRRQPGEELPAEPDCQYRLKGVVIHSGTPESGHYYSLIRVEGDSWIRFDDSRVTEFNIRDLEEEAFGGKEEASEWAAYSKSTRSKNAYILLFEKINKADIVLENITKEELPIYQAFAEPVSTEETQEGKYSLVVKTFKNRLPANFEEEMKKDNRSFFHERQYHHEYFRRFVTDFLLKLSIPKPIQDQFQIEQLKAYYSQYRELSEEQQTLLASTHEMLETLIDNLSKLYNPDETIIKTIGHYLFVLEFAAPLAAQKYFMNTDLRKHAQVLHSNTNQLVRELYRMTANKCINIIIHLRNVDLLSETDDETTPYRQKILAFLNDYLSVLYTEVPKGWLKSYNYFDFLKWFTCTNDTSKRFCFERDIICQLVDLLLEKKSPIRTVEKKYDLYIKSCTQSLGPIIQTIVNLVSASHNELAAKREPQEKFLHVLTENERKCLTSIDFYRLVLENYKQDIASLSYLIVRFCTNNAGLSEGIAALLVHSINQSEGYESALCCMGLIHTFMLIKDEFTHQRLRWLFGVPQYLAAGNEFSIKNTVDSQVVTYMSSLYFSQLNYKSVLELLFSQRRSPDNFSVAGVSTLLNTLVCSQQSMLYVLDLPPPSYCYATYVDWIDKFIQDVKNEKYPTLNGDRAVMSAELAKSMVVVRAKLNELRIARGLQSEELQSVEDVKDVSKEISTEPQIPPPPVVQPTVQVQGDATITTEVPALIPALIPGPIQEDEKLLYSTQPIVIFGRTHHTDVLPDLSPLKEGEVLISTIVHHVYTIESLPTGHDNQSLRKDLFEAHSNYDLSPLKFFTYKESQLSDEEHPINVHIEPRIIMIKVTNKLPIILKINHPHLQADIYLPEGIYYANTPYTELAIDKWLQVEPTGKKDLPGLTAPNLTDAQVSSSSSYPNPHSSGFIGPLAPDHYQSAPMIDTPPVFKNIVCPMCTYDNYGVSVCEVCFNPLPT